MTAVAHVASGVGYWRNAASLAAFRLPDDGGRHYPRNDFIVGDNDVMLGEIGETPV